MQVLPVYRTILDGLNNGRVARFVCVSLLRSGGVVMGILAFFLLVQLLKWSFQAESTESTFAGLALALILAVTFLGVVYVFFYRAESASKLRDPHYSVIPIASVLLRAAGEIYSMLGISIGVGGCVFIWLAKSNPLGLLGKLGAFFPSVPLATGLGGFVGGLLFLAYFVVQAFVVLVVCYFLAEALVVLVEIASNTRRAAESIPHLARRDSAIAGERLEPAHSVPVALASARR